MRYKLTVGKCRCENCGYVYSMPVIGNDFMYGCMTMHSQTGDTVYLPVLEHPEFDEVDNFLLNHKNLKRFKLKKMERRNSDKYGAIHRALFSSTCDPAPDGSTYGIDQIPDCPKCEENKGKFVDRLDEAIELEYKEPTHEKWNSLSEDEKVDFLFKALEEMETP